MENPFEAIHIKLDFIIAELKKISDNLPSDKPEKANYNKREAANELSCGVPMIDKLLRSGRLEKIKVGAKVLIPRTSIDRILNNRK